MKIVLPVDENRDTVCVAFARAPYFLTYDTDTDTTEILVNPAAQANGGAGVKAAQFIVDLKADALITVRLGQNSAEILSAAMIKIYKAGAVGAKMNVDLLKEGGLSELTEFHAGFIGRT